MVTAAMPKWMTVEKLSALVGLTREAIYALKKKGKLRQNVHWIKKGRRLFIHVENFNKWLEGTRE